MRQPVTLIRRSKTQILGAVSFAMVALASIAQAALVSAEWNSGFANNGVIPDDTDSGWVDERVVNTSFRKIENLSVSLSISGGFNGDLYAYLEHEGSFAVLLNRVGRTAIDPIGYEDSGFEITLRDAANVTTDIHLYGGNAGDPVTGTFQSDGRNVDPDDVLDTDPRDARLTEFEGMDPNGEWTLFIADLSGGEASTVLSWRLDIQAVPEPGIGALAVMGCAIWFMRGPWRWTNPLNSSRSGASKSRCT